MPSEKVTTLLSMSTRATFRPNSTGFGSESAIRSIEHARAEQRELELVVRPPAHVVAIIEKVLQDSADVNRRVPGRLASWYPSSPADAPIP